MISSIQNWRIDLTRAHTRLFDILIDPRASYRYSKQKPGRGANRPPVVAVAEAWRKPHLSGTGWRKLFNSATSSHNGRLWDALLPFLERETAARYRDVSLDAELNLSFISYIATANSIEPLPAPLKDRFRMVKVPAPGLSDLPLLAANVLEELAVESGEQGFVWPLAHDELEVIARACKTAGFSIRKLQKILEATVEARNATAVRH
jgi:hypothetical protein